MNPPTACIHLPWLPRGLLRKALRRRGIRGKPEVTSNPIYRAAPQLRTAIFKMWRVNITVLFANCRRRRCRSSCCAGQGEGMKRFRVRSDLLVQSTRRTQAVVLLGAARREERSVRLPPHRSSRPLRDVGTKAGSRFVYRERPHPSGKNSGRQENS